jgi:Fe-S oxidoreductase
VAPFINSLQGSDLFRKVLEKTTGFSRNRTLPKYASQSFQDWYKKHYKSYDGPPVVLFADTYLNFHEPEIGKAAVRLINHLGFDVALASGCCQRPRISHGFLDLAKRKGTGIAQYLDNFLQRDVPILVCEPSCASALTDDLPDMLDDKALGARMMTGIVPIERWVNAQIEDRSQFTLRTRSQKILLHGHCHQKTLFGTKPLHRILKACGAEVFEPDSGCCGMAGSFGYEKEHQEISEKMARRVLIPAIEREDANLVVASGFSCRHQIGHFTGRKAVHWLEALDV